MAQLADKLRFFTEADQLRLLLHLDAQRTQMIAQNLLGLRLRQKERKWIAAGNLLEIERSDLLALAVNFPVLQRPSRRNRSLRKTIALQLFERPRLHHKRLRMQRGM